MDGLRVECRSAEAGEVPARFGFDPNAMQEIDEVLDRWPGPDHRYFRVRTRDGGLYILRQDERSQTWQIHLFEGEQVE